MVNRPSFDQIPRPLDVGCLLVSGPNGAAPVALHSVEVYRNGFSFWLTVRLPSDDGPMSDEVLRSPDLRGHAPPGEEDTAMTVEVAADDTNISSNSGTTSHLDLSVLNGRVAEGWAEARYWVPMIPLGTRAQVSVSWRGGSLYASCELDTTGFASAASQVITF